MENLFGKYTRLRRELVDAYNAPHWRGDIVNRLADDLAEVERAIACIQPIDEQTTDPLPGL